ncbi:MAG: hypothetical protein EBZ61_10850 [Micrococcales bacterium]|nr:hypothetical protein [Micrococcales bacterium]
MNRDDIIRMAREAGYGEAMADLHAPALQRFAEIVATAEREECARVCDDNAITMPKSEYAEACQDCAYIIRARTNQGE